MTSLKVVPGMFGELGIFDAAGERVAIHHTGALRFDARIIWERPELIEAAEVALARYAMGVRM